MWCTLIATKVAAGEGSSGYRVSPRVVSGAAQGQSGDVVNSFVMSLSSQERSEECKAVLTAMLGILGGSAIDETLFDPQSKEFETVHPTTWDELFKNGWIEQLESVGRYRLTGTGWLGALRLTAQLGERQFAVNIGRTLAAMKAHVRGRVKSALVPLKQVAQEACLPEGFVYNVVESRLLEEHHGRTGAKWQDKGRLVLIPRDFNIEPTDLNTLIQEEAERRIEEIEERLQQAEDELGRYQCPHCRAPLCGTGSVELSEHDEGAYDVFECGYRCIDGFQQRPCPKDPKFPKLDEFELKIVQTKSGEWMCYAIGQTKYALQLESMSARGRTEEEAKRRVIAQYNYKAGIISNEKYIEQQLG